MIFQLGRGESAAPTLSPLWPQVIRSSKELEWILESAFGAQVTLCGQGRPGGECKHSKPRRDTAVADNVAVLCAGQGAAREGHLSAENAVPGRATLCAARQERQPCSTGSGSDTRHHHTTTSRSRRQQMLISVYLYRLAMNPLSFGMIDLRKLPAAGPGAQDTLPGHDAQQACARGGLQSDPSERRGCLPAGLCTCTCTWLCANVHAAGGMAWLPDNTCQIVPTRFAPGPPPNTPSTPARLPPRPQDRDKFIRNFVGAREEMQRVLAQHGKTLPAGGAGDICTIM